MSKNKLPFNVEIMSPTKQRLQALKPVRVLDIYEGATGNFHEDGLYSHSIFGQTGTEERSNRFSFIDMKVEIFHPLVFRHIGRLSSLYKGILMGRQYAKWNAKEKNFEETSELDGETGYTFFLKHWREIKWKRTDSDARQLRIDVIEKYKDRALSRYLMVLPAGMRDIQVDQSGRVTEDEINDMYRRVISISNTLDEKAAGVTGEAYDQARVMLQMAHNEIYDFIERIITGKKGFIQGRWGSRRIFNGTRNVISSMDTGAADLDGPTMPETYNTVVGLYQTAKGVLPKTIFFLMQGHLSKVFTGSEGPVYLINPKTMKTELVEVSTEARDRWTTEEGLEKYITYYGNVNIRHKPVKVDDHYFALIYKDDKGFRILDPHEEADLTKEQLKNVHPLTHCELLYLSGYQHWNKFPVLITRYPITGLGSTYPSMAYVKTTVVGLTLAPLGRDFNILEDEPVAYEFPTYNGPHMDTLIPHPSRLPSLGADFDGDTCSANFIITDEAIEEINKYFNTKEAFLDPRGGLQQAGSDLIDWVLNNFTSDVAE